MRQLALLPATLFLFIAGPSLRPGGPGRVWSASGVIPPSRRRAPLSPQDLVNGSLEAMGGTTLRHARSLRVSGIEHLFALGNAERAEGPWRVVYAEFAELRDLSDLRLRRNVTPLGARNAQPPATLLVSDSVAAAQTSDHQTGATRSTVEDALDRVGASPERALSLAAASSDLRSEGTVSHWGVIHDMVSFPWRTGRMRIEISRESHLPTAVEIVRTYPNDFRRAPFGDITLRFEYVDWDVGTAGIWWPRQQIISQNGEPLRNITIDSVAFDSTPVPSDTFAISDSARAQFATNAQHTVSVFRRSGGSPATELRDGILRVPDYWTMTVVRQDDGIVIFEAHISAAYLHDVIGEARHRYPGLPIKGIVMSSDPWAHLGGVREAMAMGIPIYVNARSVPFLQKLSRAPHTLDPDSLQRAPRVPHFIPVSGKTVVGTGKNRIELYPVGGPYAERMTMAYFPELRLLYGADLVFAARHGDGYDRAPAIDLRRAVARERLAVDTVFCVQATPSIAWSSFVPAGMATDGVPGGGK
jgi:hypothetical protein